LYVVSIFISNGLTGLKWIRELEKTPHWGGCQGDQKQNSQSRMRIRSRRPSTLVWPSLKRIMSLLSFIFPPRPSHSQQCILFQP